MEFIATESFHRLRPMAELLPRPGEVPTYERVGEARVAAGLYRTVLRWRHLEPIVHALMALARETEPAA
jgi:hypothetical protein